MYRDKSASAPAKARKNNLWICLYGNRWFTPDEFVWKFGERPENIPHSAIKLLNPLPFKKLGRDIVREKIRQGKSKEEILLALDKLLAFEDKIEEKEYKPIAFQEDSVPWPDPEPAPRIATPPTPPPDYNDLVNEKAQLAIETANQKVKEWEEQEMKRRRDKFTRMSQNGYRS